VAVNRQHGAAGLERPVPHVSLPFETDDIGVERLQPVRLLTRHVDRNELTFIWPPSVWLVSRMRIRLNQAIDSVMSVVAEASKISAYASPYRRAIASACSRRAATTSGGDSTRAAGPSSGSMA